MAAFLGAALGPMIGGPLLYLVGSKNSENGASDDGAEEYGLAGYAVLLSLSTLYFLASAWSLCYIRDH